MISEHVEAPAGPLTYSAPEFESMVDDKPTKIAELNNTACLQECLHKPVRTKNTSA